VLRIRHDGRSQGISPRPTEMAEFRVGELPWPSLVMVQSGWTCDPETTTKARMLLPPLRGRGYHSRIRQVRWRPEGEGRSHPWPPLPRLSRNPSCSEVLGQCPERTKTSGRFESRTSERHLRGGKIIRPGVRLPCTLRRTALTMLGGMRTSPRSNTSVRRCFHDGWF
jgi:hypothetical protein